MRHFEGGDVDMWKWGEGEMRISGPLIYRDCWQIGKPEKEDAIIFACFARKYFS
jgi:hypothetical protein